MHVKTTGHPENGKEESGKDPEGKTQGKKGKEIQEGEDVVHLANKITVTPRWVLGLVKEVIVGVE
jgi:hypothetical protein